MRMRIAIIDLGYHWPSTVGSITHTHGVATMLSDNGHDVHLFGVEMDDCFPRGRMQADPGYPVTLISLDRSEYTPQNISGQFKAVIDSYRPDMIYFGEAWSMKNWVANALVDSYPCLLRFYAYEMLCPFATLFSRQMGGRYCGNDILTSSSQCSSCFDFAYPPEQISQLVDSATSLTAFEAQASDYFSPQYRSVLKNVIQKAYCCLPQNRFLADRLQTLGGKTRVIPPGLNVAEWPHVSPSPRNTVRFLAPGRLDADYKGLPFIQKAAERLWRRRQDFIVQVTTDAPGHLSPGVESVGLRPHSEMPALYACCDVVLSLSAHPEPLPYSGVEAFASGRPVIATQIGGMVDLVGDSSAGSLVPVGDDEALATVMERYITQPEERLAAGRAARLRAQREYDWGGLYQRQYSDLLKSFRPVNQLSEPGVCRTNIPFANADK